MSQEWKDQFDAEAAAYKAEWESKRKIEATLQDEKQKKENSAQDADKKIVSTFLEAIHAGEILGFVQQHVFDGKGEMQDVFERTTVKINRYEHERITFHESPLDERPTGYEDVYKYHYFNQYYILTGKSLDLHRDDDKGTIDSLFIGFVVDLQYTYRNFGLVYSSSEDSSSGDISLVRRKQASGLIDNFQASSLDLASTPQNQIGRLMQDTAFKDQTQALVQNGMLPLIKTHFLPQGKMPHRYV